MSFYKDKKILVTGGTGFVGSHLVEDLVSKGAQVRTTGRKQNPNFLTDVMTKIDYFKTDLTDPQNCVKAIQDMDMVFHLASTVAAIQYSKDHHATMFSPDVQMTLNMMNACAKSNSLDRILITSSSCIYKRDCSVPFEESDGFLGNPEPTAFGYGWAKRMAETTATMFKNQFELKSAIVRLENVYGPRDNFSPQHAHVIPSLIRRAIEADTELVVWGDGKQTRSFLYVEDAVEGMLLAMEKYAVSEPLNIASGNEITMNKIAKIILELLGKSDIKIVHDLSKPTGQTRKASSIEKMKKVLNFMPPITIREGIKKSIDWAKANNVLKSSIVSIN